MDNEHSTPLPEEKTDERDRSSSPEEKENKQIPPYVKSAKLSHTLVYLCIVLVIALIAWATILIFYAKRDVEQATQLISRVEILETQVEAIYAIDPELFEGLENPQASQTAEVTTLQEAVEYLNIQYDNFVDQINIFFIVITIAAGLITFVVPILNYQFVQKDHIERMEKLTDCMNQQVKEMNDEFLEQKAQYVKNEQAYTRLNKQIGNVEKKSKLRLVGLGKALRDQQEQFGKNTQEFESLKGRMEASNAEARERLMKLEKQMLAVSKASLQADDEQTEEIPALSESSVDKAHALYMEALIKMRRKDYTQAIKLLTEAIHLDPEKAEYYDKRSYIYHEVKRYEDALQDANKAIQLEPDNARYYDERGVTLHAMKRYEDALQDISKAIQLEPENARYYNSRGVTLHELKRYEEALRDTNKAIELETENAEYYDSRGVALHELKRYEEALWDANRAIELEPKNAQYYDSRGVTLHKMKRYEDALRDADKAIELESENGFYIARVARCYISFHNSTQAKEFLDKALSLDPTDSYALRVRGLYNLALLKNKQPAMHIKDIQADFDQAVIDNPDNVYSRLNRADFFIFTEKYEEAKEDLDKALQIDPLEPEAYYWYSQYYKATNKPEKAAEYRKLADEHGYIPEPPTDAGE